MPRKKYSPQTDITPTLLKFRVKKKWQIALRRYVLEERSSAFYAPYFGLDRQNIRKWFEAQFKNEVNWDNFATSWQFDHIVPVTYFDFDKETDLKMCWNFTNLRVELFQQNKERGNRVDVLAAHAYFESLYKETRYKPCLDLLEKIKSIEIIEIANSKAQIDFIQEQKSYLDMIEGFSAFEFELLNEGRSIEEVKKEIGFLKKYDK